MKVFNIDEYDLYAKILFRKPRLGSIVFGAFHIFLATGCVHCTDDLGRRVLQGPHAIWPFHKSEGDDMRFYIEVVNRGEL